MYANGNFHHVTLIFNVILIIYFALCDFNVMETLFIEVEKVNYSVRIFQNVEHNRQNRNRIIVMKETSNFEYILLDVKNTVLVYFKELFDM